MQGDALLKIENNEQCTGCGACKNICKRNAISMIEDEEGFLKPLVDHYKCINCSLCDNICPIFNYKSSNTKNPKSFLFMNKDKIEKEKSSSGAFFPLIAKYIIEQNGIVFGVIWDENIKAIQASAQNFDELEKMRGSKYVQADTKSTFKEVQYFLDKGKVVLYSGTPCQIAGLKSFLKKDYQNLITIDLICHGVPSRKIFEYYKKMFLKQKRDNTKIININMRPKPVKFEYIHYWKIETLLKTYKISMQKNPFVLTFLYNLNLNKSCINCRFNCLPRVGDITIGDFNGVEYFENNLKVEDGVSVILLNNKKGERFYEEISKQQISKEVPFEKVVRYNLNIVEATRPHEKRDAFFKNFLLKEQSMEDFAKRYIKIYPFEIIYIYKRLPNFIKKIIKKILAKND